jgi:hypothetical protein
MWDLQSDFSFNIITITMITDGYSTSPPTQDPDNIQIQTASRFARLELRS